VGERGYKVVWQQHGHSDENTEGSERRRGRTAEHHTRKTVIVISIARGEVFDAHCLCQLNSTKKKLKNSLSVSF
jgi:hypothetical protein